MPTILPNPHFLYLFLSVGFLSISSGKFIDLTFHVTEHPEPSSLIGNIIQSIVLPKSEVQSMSVESPPQAEWNTLVNIDSSNGDIWTSPESRNTLDREIICPLTSKGERIHECKISFLISINKKILVTLHLIIDDLNDSPPVFFYNGHIIREFSVSFSEAATVGEATANLPIAIDPDLESPASSVNYHIIGEKLPFVLLQTRSTPKIRLTGPLDYERVPMYTFFLQACKNQRFEHMCSSIHVTVNVENVNDHKPVFLNLTYNAVINEDTPVGSFVLVVEALDADDPPFGNVSYSLVIDKQNAETFPFAVDEQNGQIFLRFSNLQPRKYSFIVEATDDSNTSTRSTTLVNIFVADVNDHKPVIEMKPFSNSSSTVYATTGGGFVVELQEEVKDPTVLAYLTVTDLDEGSNALCTCHLKDSPFSSAFELKKVNQLSPQMTVYRLVSSKPLDAEDSLLVRHLIEPIESEKCKGIAGFLALVITCSDSGDKPLYDEATVYVALRGIEEFPTEFIFPDSTGVYRLSVEENTKPGTKLMELAVTDKDTGRCTQMSITDTDQVIIESDSGSLVLISPLDYEKENSFKFIVTASDKNEYSPSKTSATATVVVEIINVNDNKPRLVSLKSIDDKTCQKMISAIIEHDNQVQECFSLDVEEEIEPGFFINHLEAFDADTPNLTQGFTFSLAGAYVPIKSQKADRLSVSPLQVTSNGDLIVSGRLDREQFGWVDLLISVSDGEEKSVSLLHVNLLDINDNTPVWQFPSPTDYHISVSLFADPDAVVSRVQALDADSGILNGGLEYKILPQQKSLPISGLLQDQMTNSLYGAHLFLINPHTGKLSVKQPLPNQTEIPYRLDLIVTDKGKPTLEATAHLLISLVDKPFIEMQDVQMNPIGSSNNLQNDGVETNPAPVGTSGIDIPDYTTTPMNMENLIHIIGISAGALTLLFFIAIISFVLCKRMHGGSRSLCQKPADPIELKLQPRQSWNPNPASAAHEILLEKSLSDGTQNNHPSINSIPVSMVESPSCSIAINSGTHSALKEMSGAQNVPVIVSLAVLPASSPSANVHFRPSTEYVVISDGMAVESPKSHWEVVSESRLVIAER
nr:protocadherin 1 [Hymenolepis microstoma]